MISIIICLIFFKSALALEDLHVHKDKGFNWYKDIPKEIKESTSKKNTPPIPNGASSYTELLEQRKKDFEEIFARARITRKPEDILKFLQAQEREFNESTDFAKIATRTTAFNPQFYSNSNNASPLHQKIYKQQKQLKLSKNIRLLSRDWGLFFAFDVEDPKSRLFCEKFAPIVKRFAQKYGFIIKGVSPNKGRVGIFKSEITNKEILSTINKRNLYPSLFLVNRHSKQILPISWGFITLDKLELNFEHFIKQLKEK